MKLLLILNVTLFSSFGRTFVENMSATNFQFSLKHLFHYFFCRLTNSFQNIQYGLAEMTVEEDLKKYADQKGTGMAMGWPKFVVCVFWHEQEQIKDVRYLI